jgi:hypothetical protein
MCLTALCAFDESLCVCFPRLNYTVLHVGYPSLCSGWVTGLPICQSPWNHTQILGSRRVTWSTFHTEDPQFCSDLWTSLLPVVFCSVRVGWHTVLYIRGKLQLLCWKHEAMTQNSIVRATRVWDLCTPEVGYGLDYWRIGVRFPTESI